MALKRGLFGATSWRRQRSVPDDGDDLTLEVRPHIEVGEAEPHNLGNPDAVKTVHSRSVSFKYQPAGASRGDAGYEFDVACVHTGDWPVHVLPV